MDRAGMTVFLDYMTSTAHKWAKFSSKTLQIKILYFLINTHYIY